MNEIIHQIESVLEALMEEKDKTVQKIGDQPSFREVRTVCFCCLACRQIC